MCVVVPWLRDRRWEPVYDVDAERRFFVGVLMVDGARFEFVDEVSHGV